MRSVVPLSLPAILLCLACASGHPRLSHDQPDAAEAYYAAKRNGAADPQQAYAIARAQMRAMTHYSTVLDAEVARRASAAAAPIGTWTFLGPGNIGGRTRTLIINSHDPSVMYAGGVSGGIWKSVDAGASWKAVGDDLVNLAVNSMAIDPENTSVLYAGTGEGYFREEVRQTGLPLRGNGIFVTRDAGATWTQLASTAGEDFHWVNDLAVSTHDSSRLYAATRSGVWRSTDSGVRWTHVLTSRAKGGCLDLALRPDAGGDYLFAACGTLDQATVYRARHAETDDAWQPVLSEPGQGRTSLAVAPSRPDTVYALAARNESGSRNDQGLLAVFRSDHGGDPGTWTAQIRAGATMDIGRYLLNNAFAERCANDAPFGNTMGWYTNVIAVDPVDAERVFAAGVDLFRSDDGGRSWGLASYWWGVGKSSFNHADQHAIVFHPRYDGAANTTLYTGNDGGIYRTDNALARTGTLPCNADASAVTFVPLNHDFGITQFYSGAVFPDGRRFIGGTQDNGTAVGSIEGGPNGWDMVLGGDGGSVAVDPTDPRIVYAEFYYANIFRFEDGATSYVGESARHGLSDDFLFVTPFTLDANQTTRLWTGGRRVWRTEDRGNSWTVASAPLNGRVSAVAVAPGNSDTVIVATTSGTIYLNSAATNANGATEWSSAHPRDGWVSSLTFQPAGPSVLYATYAGFGGNHVWRSVDGGRTWAALDHGLPDIPVHSLAVNPDRRERLYLGTDLGVFVSVDGGEHWLVENSGFAAAVTEAVVIGPGPTGLAVYAFTHGRGVWRGDLPTRKGRAVRK